MENKKTNRYELVVWILTLLLIIPILIQAFKEGTGIGTCIMIIANFVIVIFFTTKAIEGMPKLEAFFSWAGDTPRMILLIGGIILSGSIIFNKQLDTSKEIAKVNGKKNTNLIILGHPFIEDDLEFFKRDHMTSFDNNSIKTILDENTDNGWFLIQNPEKIDSVVIEEALNFSICGSAPKTELSLALKKYGFKSVSYWKVELK